MEMPTPEEARQLLKKYEERQLFEPVPKDELSGRHAGYLYHGMEISQDEAGGEFRVEGEVNGEYHESYRKILAAAIKEATTVMASHPSPDGLSRANDAAHATQAGIRRLAAEGNVEAQEIVRRMDER